MAHMNFLHICNDAFLTAGSNSLNVIGIFDRVNAQQLPVTIPKFTVATGIDAMDGPHELSLTIKKEGDALASMKAGYVGPNHQHVHHFVNLTFKEAGEYLFELFVDGEILGTKRLMVRTIEQQNGSTS